MKRLYRFIAYIALTLVLGLWSLPITGVDGVKKGEWLFYGGDQGSTKYSPLDQINRDNVKNLKVAWTWDSPDLKLIEANSKLFTFGFEGTPLMVGGVLWLVGGSLQMLGDIAWMRSVERSVLGPSIAAFPSHRWPEVRRAGATYAGLDAAALGKEPE